MLELIKGFVAKVASERIVKSNAEILVLRHKNGEKSLVNSYPAASKTLRGSGGDVLWLEEAAFMVSHYFSTLVFIRGISHSTISVSPASSSFF